MAILWVAAVVPGQWSESGTTPATGNVDTAHVQGQGAMTVTAVWVGGVLQERGVDYTVEDEGEDDLDIVFFNNLPQDILVEAQGTSTNSDPDTSMTFTASP